MDTGIINKIDLTTLPGGEKKEEIIPEKCAGLEAEAFSLRGIDERAAVVIESFFAGEPKKHRQWSTDGETLFYYESNVCYKDGENYVIDDNGFRTLTTKTIMSGLMDYLAPGMSVQSFRKAWRVDFAGKSYLWKGTMKFEAGAAGEDYVPIDKAGNLLPEAPSEQDVMKYRRELSYQISADIKKIEAALLETGDPYSVDLASALDVENYAFPYGISSLSDLFYSGYDMKGYRDPSYMMDYANTWVASKDIKRLTNMQQDKSGAFLITYDYKGKHEDVSETVTVPVEELGDQSEQQLMEALSQKPALTEGWESKKKDLREFLTHYALLKKTQDETGRDVEVLRN